MRRSRIGALIRASRPLAHGNLAPALLFGQALAYAQTGRFAWAGFALAHAFGLIDHLMIVFANDYADRDADARNDLPTPFSGGSRVLVDGELAPRTLRRSAIGAGIALVGLSGLAAATAPLLPILAVAAIALLGAYSYPPLRLSYRGGGELLQGLGVGVVLPLVGLVAQGGTIDGEIVARVVPTFVLGVTGNVITSIPDADADRAASKASPAARWGVARARVAAAAMTGVALALGAWTLPGSWPVAAASGALVSLGLALPATTRPRLVLGVALLGAAGVLAIVGWTVRLFVG